MKWVLVTGGAKKLGAEIVTTLSKRGKNVVLQYYSSQKEAENLANILRSEGKRVECVFGDFSSLDSTERFFYEYQKQFLKTEGWVNTIGPYLVGSSLETSVENAQNLIQMHLLFPIALMQKLKQALQMEKGSVIQIGMVGCHMIRASTHATIYNMAKSALYHLTRSWALELGKDGVRVNMISPGYLEESVELPPLSQIPMGRVGRFQEVADLVAFILEQDYITGQNIEIAGGVRL